ncbi:MAG: trehalose-phosphatase [Candidatus Competibacteraceae bacterium]|nr:trehalose-phosphatase [Candidatus Competibacteraceae bacterium]
MSSVSHRLVEQLATAYLRGERLVLVFDYDGTLAPFAARPNLAHLSPELRALLAGLAAMPRLAVGVVSGRGLDDLMAMVGVPGLYFGGTFGLELDLRGERIVPAELSQPRQLMRDLLAAMEARLPLYPGAWVEKKQLGLTIHYRQLRSDRIEALRAELFALLEPHAAVARIYEAPLALEVLPAIGVDKGTALQAIVAHHHSDRPALVLYAGDAANDAAALTVASKLGGIAVGIGPEPPPEAVYHLSDYRVLTAFLTELASVLTSIRRIA